MDTANFVLFKVPREHVFLLLLKRRPELLRVSQIKLFLFDKCGYTKEFKFIKTENVENT